MLAAYVPRGTTLQRVPITAAADVPEGTVWFDLISPTQEEDKIVEQALGIAVPTREEMQDSKSPAAST